MHLDINEQSYVEEDVQTAWYSEYSVQDLRQYTKLECLVANTLTVLLLLDMSFRELCLYWVSSVDLPVLSTGGT